MNSSDSAAVLTPVKTGVLTGGGQTLKNIAQNFLASIAGKLPAMTIKQRIVLLNILAFIAIIWVGGYALFQSKMNAAQVKNVTGGVVPSAMATSDLISHLKEVQLTTLSLVAEPNKELVLTRKDKLVESKAKLKESIELQLKMATGEAQKGLALQLMENLSDYFGQIDNAIKFKLEGNQTMAEATFYGSVAPYQNEMGQMVETVRIEKNREKDLTIEQLNQSLSNTAIGIAIVVLITNVILIVFGIRLYRQVITPISEMQEATNHIASTQDFSRQIPVKNMDEIGRSIAAFNMMITKIQENSALLKQKTADIQAMLQNMPQGILTITEDQKIHPEYSAYLETIFETGDIAGREIMDLVFSGSNLEADTLSQIDAVAGACFREDVMNFDFNKHLLVGEIEKKVSGGHSKILDLSWSPITDDTNNTVRIMLCIRDVTELRQLAAEAHKQKRELEIIGEILAVTQEKFYEFITSSSKFIDENELLIRENPEHNQEVLTKMFRNMHTIKGNARTYGLSHLTNIVHTTEQTYVELREPRPKIAWDQATLLNELFAVKDTLENYAKINEVVLGRKGPGRRGSAEHFLMVDKHLIQETIKRLENANTGNQYEMLALHDSVRKTLRLLGTERITETLSGVFNSLPALANELAKDNPIVSVQENGYVLHNQASGVVKNVFMHLIRNSMDHGLETREERISQNKPAAGTIRLAMDVRDGMLRIKLSDDGRGIGLQRIRQIAIEKGLINSDSQLTDEETAELIFKPGFSTAAKVTEVSGRGVGMDVVLNFVKREGGLVKLHFTDCNVGANFRQFETVVYLPETLSERIS